MSKNNITKGIWLIQVQDKDSNEVIEFVAIATSKQDCRELITEKEYERNLKFNSISKFGNLAPTLYDKINPEWQGESLIILSNSQY